MSNRFLKRIAKAKSSHTRLKRHLPVSPVPFTKRPVAPGRFLHLRLLATETTDQAHHRRRERLTDLSLSLKSSSTVSSCGKWWTSRSKPSCDENDRRPVCFCNRPAWFGLDITNWGGHCSRRWGLQK